MEEPEHDAQAARDESSANELSGGAHGPTVQARSIHGGVHVSVSQPAPTPSWIPVPAQLPLATAHFTNRSRELADLDRAAADYDPVRRQTVVVICGAGGAGKTALATRWLNGISESYDGGVLYADLYGHLLARARQPSEVLTGFLSALGTSPERIPLELDQQAALFRSLTSGRRMAVLLDNAASAAQVRALLPGPGPRPAEAHSRLPTLVVATTRWRITGLAMDGARFIELGPLDDQAAGELLTRMVGDDRASAEADAVRSLVRLCAGLPLAICVAGAQLTSHARWPVGRLATELASEQHRLAALAVGDDLSVRAAFDLSYQALAAEAARMYRLVSLTDGPDFGRELAAATAGIGPEQAAGLLDALAGASLLEETGELRYRFHDLVRLHAREYARAGERPAAIARAIGWYLTKAVAADLVIIPGRSRLNPMYERARAGARAFGGPPEALEWMESELPGLLAAVRTAHDEGLHEQAWQLCEALWGLFSYRKYFRHWIDTHLLGIASARACGNQHAEAELLVQLGLGYLNLGRQQQAREEFGRALVVARQAGHRPGEASALEYVGVAELSMGRPEQAIGWFGQARDIFQDIGASRGVMGQTRHIGEAHRDAGQLEEAVRYLLQARQLARALPDPYNEARSLTSLGQAYLKAGQHDAAVRALTEALGIMTGLGGHYEQARIRVMLADILLRLGQAGQARDHLAGALTIYSGIGAPEADEIRCRLAGLGQ